MTQTIEAIYQGGIFRPLKPVSPDLKEGQEVLINVESVTGGMNRIMQLAENFYEGLSEDVIDEIEEVALDRSSFFGERVR